MLFASEFKILKTVLKWKIDFLKLLFVSKKIKKDFLRHKNKINWNYNNQNKDSPAKNQLKMKISREFGRDVVRIMFLHSAQFLPVSDLSFCVIWSLLLFLVKQIFNCTKSMFCWIWWWILNINFFTIAHT